MAEGFESEEVQKLLRQRVTLLQCTSEYPTPINELNLRAIDTLRKAFGVRIGFSDQFFSTPDHKGRRPGPRSGFFYLRTARSDSAFRYREEAAAGMRRESESLGSSIGLDLADSAVRLRRDQQPRLQLLPVAELQRVIEQIGI